MKIMGGHARTKTLQFKACILKFCVLELSKSIIIWMLTKTKKMYSLEELDLESTQVYLL